MMSMLIPFWVWMILGAVLALWLRRILVRRFGFINKLSRPFRPKKKKKPPIRRNNNQPEGHEEPVVSEEEEETGVERIKSAAKKGAGFLARPLEYFLGGPDDEEDEDE